MIARFTEGTTIVLPASVGGKLCALKIVAPLMKHLE
jgi:hypothetical protein